MDDSQTDIWSDTTGEKYLYRYRPASVFAIDEIVHSYLYMASYKKLNDLNECRPFFYNSDENPTKEKKLELVVAGARARKLHNLHQDIIREFAANENNAWSFVEKTYAGLIASAEDAALRVLEEVEWGVCCFSKMPLNPTMMAHYGNNEGLIICYDAGMLRSMMPDVTLWGVHYRNDPAAINILEIAFGPEVTERETASSLITTQKSSDWAYEREVRIVSEYVCESPLWFDQPVIKGICVGPKASDAMIRLACKLASDIGVSAYQAERATGYNFSPKLITFDGFEAEVDA